MLTAPPEGAQKRGTEKIRRRYGEDTEQIRRRSKGLPVVKDVTAMHGNIKVMI